MILWQEMNQDVEKTISADESRPLCKGDWEDKVQYGGQAVIEGVMMRTAKNLAVAVRTPGGKIVMDQRGPSGILVQHPRLNIPFIRGFFALIDSISTGLSALTFSANAAIGEEGGEGEEMPKWVLWLTIAAGFGIAIPLFMLLPTYLAAIFKNMIQNHLYVNIIEGGIRLVIFIGYILAITIMPDMRRIFQYHGAEHKAINALEAGAELKVESVQKYSTRHPRCGTNFIVIVLIMSIILFSFFGWPSHLVRTVIRLALLPVIAGISYEIIKVLGRYRNAVPARILMAPGLWVQALTTRSPMDDQVEVALAALAAVREQRPTREPADDGSN